MVNFWDVLLLLPLPLHSVYLGKHVHSVLDYCSLGSVILCVGPWSQILSPCVVFFGWAGGYDTEEKAARSYDLAALKYWGSSTVTNFPVMN